METQSKNIKQPEHQDALPVVPVKAEQVQQSSRRRLSGIALFSILAALMLTLLLEALDQTIVGTALPKIIGSLQGFDRYTWVVTAYLLGSTTMIPVVGKLSDQFGRKWFFVTGVVLFLLGSALSGASQTIDQLIAFRALQGVGAGVGIERGFLTILVFCVGVFIATLFLKDVPLAENYRDDAEMATGTEEEQVVPTAL